MPTLSLINFNIALSILGGWVSLFGLVSYSCKETLYIPETLTSLLAGVGFGPHAANFIRPLEYAGSQANLDAATLYFSRLVLGVQLMLAGVQLPSQYLKQEWRPLFWLLGPIMTAMWLTTSLLVWALVGPSRLSFLHALAIGSCVTPTDPVLSNVIVKGRFAEKNVPVSLQNIIIAEASTNDGLGYPFLFLALYLIQYTGGGDSSASGGGTAHAMGLWFGETMGYTVLLSVVYGGVVGYVAKELLHWAKARKYVDRESFLVFAVSLALFIVGTCGLLGSDDVLACFIAGNAFTWDDWFRIETQDDSLQPVVDMLLNVSIFMWYGAVCPWSQFLHGPVPLYRLVGLGILVLLLRRLPWVLALWRFIPQIKNVRHALFLGYFGPIGVSAVFYLYVTLEFLQKLPSAAGVPGELRPDVVYLAEAVNVVVWFIIICSVVGHGLTVPLGKLSLHLPRTINRTMSSALSLSFLGGGSVRHIAPGSKVRMGVMRRDSAGRGAGEGDGDGGVDDLPGGMTHGSDGVGSAVMAAARLAPAKTKTSSGDDSERPVVIDLSHGPKSSDGVLPGVLTPSRLATASPYLSGTESPEDGQHASHGSSSKPALPGPDLERDAAAAVPRIDPDGREERGEGCESC